MVNSETLHYVSKKASGRKQLPEAGDVKPLV